MLEDGFKPGITVTILGLVESDPEEFAVNLLCPTKDVAFHFNPRFAAGGLRTIVCNSYINGIWKKEIQPLCGFPFAGNKPFKIQLYCENDYIGVIVDEKLVVTYKHVVAKFEKITAVQVTGNVKLVDVHHGFNYTVTNMCHEH